MLLLKWRRLKLHALKTIALMLLAVILIVTSWAYMAFLGMERTALNTSYYKHIFSETDLLPAVHGQLQDQMKENILSDMAAEHEKMMEEIPVTESLEQHEHVIEQDTEQPSEELMDTMMGALGRTFHVEWLERKALRVIEDSLALVKGERDGLTVVLDLGDRRERLHEELTKEMKQWPPEMLADIDIEPGDVEEGAARMVEEFDLPAQLDLSQLGEEIITPAAAETISSVQKGRTYFLFVPYLLFAVIFILDYRLAGFYGGMKWFGAALFISGCTFLVGALAVPSLLTAVFAANMEELPLESATITAVVQYTAGRMALVPLIFVAMGLALLLGAIIKGKKNRET